MGADEAMAAVKVMAEVDATTAHKVMTAVWTMSTTMADSSSSGPNRRLYHIGTPHTIHH